METSNMLEQQCGPFPDAYDVLNGVELDDDMNLLSLSSGCLQNFIDTYLNSSSESFDCAFPVTNEEGKVDIQQIQDREHPVDTGVNSGHGKCRVTNSRQSLPKRSAGIQGISLSSCTSDSEKCESSVDKCGYIVSGPLARINVHGTRSPKLAIKISETTGEMNNEIFGEVDETVHLVQKQLKADFVVEHVIDRVLGRSFDSDKHVYKMIEIFETPIYDDNTTTVVQSPSVAKYPRNRLSLSRRRKKHGYSLCGDRAAPYNGRHLGNSWKATSK